MIAPEENSHPGDSGSEAHSGGYQLDHVNRADNREARVAGEVQNGCKPHDQDEQWNEKARGKLTPISH